MTQLRLPPTGLQKVLKSSSTEEKGENARLSLLTGALAITDLLKTTLGPRGMDKILLSPSGEVSVTNDGATILKSVYVDNPAVKILVDIALVQDDEIGDGTTSVCCLAGELLREAEQLLERRLHPQLIIAGYRAAHREALKALEEAAMALPAKDTPAGYEALMNVARTALSSKVLSQCRELFAKIAVDAVIRLQGSTNLDHIKIIKKPGGALHESFLAEGFILEKRFGVGQKKRVENAKILIANTPMDTDKIKIYGARVRTESIARVAEIEQAEQEKMIEKCRRILGYGCNVFVNRQLIYNRPEQFFTDNGINSIEHADFDGIERLALVTGGEIVSTFDSPGAIRLGECAVIEEIMIGDDAVLHFQGCRAPEACSIVIRGANQQILDEAERSLHDALCVLSQLVVDSRLVLGAGCSEALMANAVDACAARMGGKAALAAEAFARALRSLPGLIAENAGLDATSLVAELRAAHAQGNTSAGLDILSGSIADARALGVVESFRLKAHVLSSATEAAEMILRVDDVIKSAPRKMEPAHPHM
ncbi:chaperonin containing TCP1, subunit 2 [Cyanidioschyzon merolae strain 10D]|jgi:T-complex protein 1 subunit beta|uniref:CCT-beta n=1 Tax=Cyanidioschyzon merolae (strain NIES-3377 / 10D) TaxID=280699 RepID=M1UXQ7_CYAM1|nr:chaperonin containing TCP1, subunit 2 [Cyanidioschyzon merolae strain 10D]BAM83286.1 chaperonin containing TCP1, subunit 2 [Cyanidioschyzon merolae strain 10D]|eukprot:XP_005539322.1 chaperonin containing TCP1, subunit 2 [Cyanidioschyzon merolae strain 10D]